jgi:hypothetical protein
LRFKKLVLLIAVLGVLAAAGVLKKAGLEKKEKNLEQTAAQAQVSLGQDFSAGFVSKIDLRRGHSEDERMVFIKDAAGQWTSGNGSGARVRKESVDALLKSLSALRGELRGDNPAVLEDFLLTDDKAFHLELFGADNKKLAHVLLSSLRPRGTQNFVRASGDNKVIVTNTDILAELNIFSKEDKLNGRAFLEPSVPADETPKAQPIPTKAKTSFIKSKSG